jgi:type III pantothenate kinase
MFALERFCRVYLNTQPLVVGSSEVALGIEVKVPRASEVGADRLVNAVAAYTKFGRDMIVIDFGTATTFDVVDNSGNYCGGVIAPGVNASIRALHMAAAKLPEIEIARPEKVIGTNTVGAMQSGVFWGYVSLIEGMLNRIKQEYKADMTVVATGGLAGLFVKTMADIEHYEPDLTVLGLKEIYERNKT